MIEWNWKAPRGKKTRNEEKVKVSKVKNYVWDIQGFLLENQNSIQKEIKYRQSRKFTLLLSQNILTCCWYVVYFDLVLQYIISFTYIGAHGTKKLLKKSKLRFWRINIL